MRFRATLVVLAGAVSVLPPPPLASAPSERGIARHGPAEPGAACTLCARPVEAEDVAFLHRGRRITLHRDACVDAWNADPEAAFRALQPRGALFQEAEADTAPLSRFWLWLGVYVVAGLLFGAACGYLAVTRGLAALPWFAAGLLLNVLALGVLLFRPRGDLSSLPAGVPRGLAKVPTTRAPARCPACGEWNHPAARRCGDCGEPLEPGAESEAGRA